MADELNECLCCQKRAQYSVLLVAGVSADGELRRWYLPNQGVREHPEHAVVETVWFCHPCMRFLEDVLRAMIYYLTLEGGPKFRGDLGIH